MSVVVLSFGIASCCCTSHRWKRFGRQATRSKIGRSPMNPVAARVVGADPDHSPIRSRWLPTPVLPLATERRLPPAPNVCHLSIRTLLSKQRHQLERRVKPICDTRWPTRASFAQQDQLAVTAFTDRRAISLGHAKRNTRHSQDASARGRLRRAEPWGSPRCRICTPPYV